MKKLFFLAFFTLFAFANTNLELVKGQALFLEFEKENLKELKIKDKNLPFFTHPKNENKILAIFSLPYKNPPQITQIKANYKDNTSKIFHIKTLEGNYKSEKITVQTQKIFPPQKVQKRIQDELKEANGIYAKSTPQALFNGTFIKPLDSFITSDFGKARIFNEQMASYHSGTDFRAAIGTKIKAANSGIVRLAKDRYYAGLSVIIDHGYGIYSQYYHLSKLSVRVGEKVEKGQVIGLSGASGRVSGPHLHFGIFAGGKQIDPLDFMQKFNALF
ncbi:M23 family metallopeptidase [Campylobacter vulpis]|uniref:M23 family metallopeptidase n=1 Tax=Campylobacter vulpis TaxID=1655500 RepID=UPI001BCAF54F|nr:M23 family metallopeptidase [Campylobacter vulpis]MBS4406119.1 M23 family metallopeptidase [Campylobacter vulpis]